LLTGFFISFLYCTDAGLSYFDVIDFYINFLLLIIGLFETFAVGWVYGIEDQVSKFGAKAVLGHAFSNFGAVFAACGLWWGLEKNAVGLGFLVFFLFWICGMVVTKFVFLKDGNYYELAFGNILELREKLKTVVGFVPVVWCYLIKQIIPHILLILLVNLCASDNGEGKPNFGYYGGYASAPYQILGILSFCFAAFLFLLGAVYPPAFNWLQPYKKIDEQVDKTSKEENLEKDKFDDA